MAGRIKTIKRTVPVLEEYASPTHPNKPRINANTIIPIVHVVFCEICKIS
jgi:hypothetical protein